MAKETIPSDVRMQVIGDDVTLYYHDGEGRRMTLDLVQYIRDIISDQLGYARGSTLNERLAYLRNDGGASINWKPPTKEEKESYFGPKDSGGA